MTTTTLKLTTYTSCTITYSITTYPTYVRLKVDGFTWKNTRSDGLTTQCWYNAYINLSGYDVIDLSNVSVAKGTKTWSRTFNKSVDIPRHIGDDRGYLLIDLVFHNSSSSWNKNKDINFNVPGREHYTITFYKNDGSSGTFGTGDKWYGDDIRLYPPNTPTRSGYTFKNWNTSADGTGTSYNNGATYTANANLNLYAQWDPAISSVAIDVDTIRVSGTTETAEDDEGTYCYGTVGYNVTGQAAGTLAFSVAVSPSGPQLDYSAASIAKQSGTELSGTFVFRASNCSTEEKYTFTVTATATNTSATQTIAPVVKGDILSTAYYPLDVLGDNYWDDENQTGERPGHGIAFGVPAKKEGFHVEMPVFIGPGTDSETMGQVVLGRYNVEDANGHYALIIGNGTSDSNRSNALAVNWNGDVRHRGAVLQSDNLTSGVAPASNANGTGEIIFSDTAGTTLGHIMPQFSASEQKIIMYAQRVVNGTTLYNTFGPGIKADGTMMYNITQPAALRNALSLRIDAGAFTYPETTASGATRDQTISFATNRFTSTPILVASFYSAATAGNFGRCCLSVLNVTSTGATIRLFNGDTSGRTPAVRWIAIQDF